MSDDDDLFETTDLLDLALLGAGHDGPLDLDRMALRVRTLCAPWLTPTTEVVEGRVATLLVRGCLRLEASQVSVTSGGRSALRALMLRPLRARSHELRFCLENLKLAFIDLVDASERAVIGRELLAARRRCLACIGGLAASCGPDRPALQACLSLRRHLMNTEVELMAEALALPS
jgi:hypothetical protein